tara:strand:- start:26 stop:1000 length:975 start_codon:yes stop_codon:yes gene_type:complete
MKNVTTSLSVGLFLFLAYIICLNSLSQAKEFSNPVSVSANITPSNFTLGDIATYTITLQHDPDIEPSSPNIEQPKGLEFIEQGENMLPEINGQKVREYWYKFRIDDTGKLSIPSIPLSFNAPDQKGKNIQGTIQAPEVSLEVKSLLNIPGGPEEIYDIKPLEEYPLPWIDYLWIALAGLAVLGLLYFIWFKWKSRPSPLNLSNSDTVLNPEQLAFKELEVLKKKQLLQIGKAQDHFFELSEIFRRYLENRYHFPAREWTTEEITAHFKNFSNLSDNLKLQARSILTQTDRVKFAKDERAEDEMPSIISFIHEAQPPITEAVNTP